MLYLRSCATLKQVPNVFNPDKIGRQERFADHSVSHYSPRCDFQLSPQLCNTREVCEGDAATSLLYFRHLIASNHQVSNVFIPDKIGRQERLAEHSVSHYGPRCDLQLAPQLCKSSAARGIRRFLKSVDPSEHSTQFHVIFYDDFPTVPNLRAGTVPSNWASLVENSRELTQP